MVTDDERRRVVAELRSVDMFDGFTFGCRWAELIFGEKPKCVEQRLRCGDCATRALRYLADLIEPSCDRDALLALASGLEADADRILKAAKSAQFGGGPRMGEAKHDADEWRSIARSIREALGVTGHADA